MTVIEKIVTAIHYTYGAQDLKTNIVTTTLYFDDGTNLALDDYWVFAVRLSYKITYNDGNPVTVTAVEAKF